MWTTGWRLIAFFAGFTFGAHEVRYPRTHRTSFIGPPHAIEKHPDNGGVHHLLRLGFRSLGRVIKLAHQMLSIRRAERHENILRSAIDMNQVLRNSRSCCLIILTCGLVHLGEAADMVLPVRQEASLRVERLSLASGAELITFFERLPEQAGISSTPQELPLMAILKDTLNDSDPSNDRIRQVWIFTYSH